MTMGHSSPTPQFSTFTQEYDFAHVTSSPRHPQSNKEAERAVRTVKQILSKNQDYQRAHLTYRTIPFAYGVYLVLHVRKKRES